MEIRNYYRESLELQGGKSHLGIQQELSAEPMYGANWGSETGRC